MGSTIPKYIPQNIFHYFKDHIGKYFCRFFSLINQNLIFDFFYYKIKKKPITIFLNSLRSVFWYFCVITLSNTIENSINFDHVFRTISIILFEMLLPVTDKSIPKIEIIAVDWQFFNDIVKYVFIMRQENYNLNIKMLTKFYFKISIFAVHK